jgi:putative FmdB family regulatory protein
MPIYEYAPSAGDNGCSHCRAGFEVLQGINDRALEVCPSCGGAVRRCISVTRVLIPGTAAGKDSIERQVAEYERQGMFSHAAELADKESEKPERAHLKERAMENYKRSGYDV